MVVVSVERGAELQTEEVDRFLDPEYHPLTGGPFQSSLILGYTVPNVINIDWGWFMAVGLPHYTIPGHHNVEYFIAICMGTTSMQENGARVAGK